MFKIVVTGIYGLVILEITGKTINGPAKGLRDEEAARLWIHSLVKPLDLYGHSRWVMGQRALIHARTINQKIYSNKFLVKVNALFVIILTEFD